MRHFWCLITLLLSFSCFSFSDADPYVFDSVTLEKRFKVLTAILRCPTCQNQNLTDSNSMVANSLKAIVFEKLIAGETDEQILDFMKKRYGEFILFEPEVSQSNLFLWTAPFLFLLFFIVIFFKWYKNMKDDIDND